MKWRLIAGTITLPVAIGAAVVATMLWRFEQELLVPPNLPRVMGLPHNYAPRQPTKPYDGPHPADMPRPHDQFVYPIKPGSVGPVEPLYAGPPQYPFVCMTDESDLGQPIVDNQDGAGIAIRGQNNEVKGYSKDCLVPTQVRYFYNRAGTEEFFPLDEADGDISQLQIGDKHLPFVVRVEMGVINRYIYLLAALKGPAETTAKIDPGSWNGRLVYMFRGGVGIGHRQGRVAASYILRRRLDALRLGYALAYSSANQTSNHYDIWLAEDTAARVKRQFAALYGEPLYTVGIGGSGGAIQQYLIGQNRPTGLLDAAIALASYPDMITQTIYALDCELLEYYFDVTAADNPKWQQWQNRRLIEGLNTLSGTANEFSKFYALVKLANGRWPSWSNGLSECVNGWRGATPLVHNPRYTKFAHRVSDNVLKSVNWSHWDNLLKIYGSDADGYARITWDNVGVQYGLASFKTGQITAEEFLHVNAHIGSWKPQREMTAERYWKRPGAESTLADASPWGHHNMRLASDDKPAPRASGDISAMEAAYRAGLVFSGHIDMPVIDLRYYLEDNLDMHHLSASFAARKRISKARGHADNHLIWVTRRPHLPMAEALDAIDRWLEALRNEPAAGVVAARPPDTTDMCFDAKGAIVAAGDSVWDGAWNGRPAGRCLLRYPAFSTSRIIAGDDWTGSVFKCHLQSVDQAIAAGLYAPHDMRPYWEQLVEIFPDGVCDYSAGDVGQPRDLFTAGVKKNGAPN
ncbi:MAG: DUF6351 family protein [Gammaproteobacteria bacterium]|nr:DUF6351 family protein [Gammaproteobacteria bacterium]MDH3768004.1 DUF6351 family protein [Gammaproteobacteria bacterium]